MLVDAGGLGRWLGGPVEVKRIHAGHSNLTFLVRFEGGEYVLRRPPAGEVAPTAHDVLREHRVLAALQDTPVRVPRVLAAGEGEGVLPDGKAFYLMERVPGTVIRSRLPSGWGDDPHDRRRVGEELVDALVELHGVDAAAVGLADLGRPSGYVERQLRRWQAQRDFARVREIPDLDVVARWLAAHVPESPPPTLVHGDYKLDNVVFADDPPARLTAILDWEMCTIGDPFADLGWLLSFWVEPGEPVEGMRALAAVSATGGFATRAELAERYGAASGRRVGDIRFYEALAVWKLAILLEASYARHLAGTTDDPFFALLETGVPELAARGRALVDGG